MTFEVDDGDGKGGPDEDDDEGITASKDPLSLSAMIG